MKICYCTRLLPGEKNFIEHYPGIKFTVSVHKFILNQIKGIEITTKEHVDIINTPLVASYPKFPKIIMHERIRDDRDLINDIDIGYINLPVIRQIMEPVILYKKICLWIKKQIDNDIIVIAHSIGPMYLWAVTRAKKRNKDIKIILCVGDLTGNYGADNHKKGIKKKIVSLYMSLGKKYVRKFDGYILVAKPMAKALGVEDKPILINECIYDKDMNIKFSDDSNSCVEENEKIIFHAGTLDRQFGIFNLLHAFEMIKEDNYRLWIAGSGDSDEEIKEYCRRDQRISFFGFVKPERIAELQSHSTVVVNPRTSVGAYTKYSFPSKTMEGLASGRPYVGYKLPSIPEEYDAFIQYADDDTPRALSEKIKKVCELSPNERYEIARRARYFILNQKNCEAFGKDMIEFIGKI